MAFKILQKDRNVSGWEEGRSRRALLGVLVLSARKRREIGASPTGAPLHGTHQGNKKSRNPY